MIKLTQTKFKMNIKPIRNEEDYKQALERLEVIFDAKRGSDEGDELEILAMVIDHYETDQFPIGMPDPIAAINFRMEQMGLKQKDLVEMIGFKTSRNNKFRTNFKTKKLNVRQSLTEVLIQDY